MPLMITLQKNDNVLKTSRNYPFGPTELFVLVAKKGTFFHEGVCVCGDFSAVDWRHHLSKSVFRLNQLEETGFFWTCRRLSYRFPIELSGS